MRRALAVSTLCGLTLLTPASALAQDESATPTTITDIDVETEEVDRADNDDDDDSDKTGLWGLLGLLGLIGLAGLARRRDHGYTSGARISGDTTPRGSSST